MTKNRLRNTTYFCYGVCSFKKGYYCITPRKAGEGIISVQITWTRRGPGSSNSPKVSFVSLKHSGTYCDSIKLDLPRPSCFNWIKSPNRIQVQVVYLEVIRDNTDGEMGK